MILNGITGKPLPVYGDGMNVRDWLFVDDHCEALRLVLDRGVPGSVYNIGGRCEKANMEVIRSICDLLDEMLPDSPHKPHYQLIVFVKDRPGHDRRYAIDCAGIYQELGWQPSETFESGLAKTVRWYLDNAQWVNSIETGAYREWVKHHYGLE